jgi:hypothetical protein
MASEKSRLDNATSQNSHLHTYCRENLKYHLELWKNVEMLGVHVAHSEKRTNTVVHNLWGASIWEDSRRCAKHSEPKSVLPKRLLGRTCIFTAMTADSWLLTDRRVTQAYELKCCVTKLTAIQWVHSHSELNSSPWSLKTTFAEICPEWRSNLTKCQQKVWQTSQLRLNLVI